MQHHLGRLHSKFALFLVTDELLEIDLLVHSALGAVDIDSQLELHLFAVVLAALAVVGDRGEEF